MDSSTITAIATPSGCGGIGIIKISGHEALRVAEAVFRPSREKKEFEKPASISKLESHRLYHGHIIDYSEEKIVDEVLLVVMRAPFSYTKEDVVEIHSHAGSFVMQSILNLALKNGAEPAEPGEFTKRAFLNGRIDLTQAEAVIDIINAKTKASMDMAVSQITGGLSGLVKKTRKYLLDVLAEMEAVIDFPEETEGRHNPGETATKLEKQVVVPIAELIEKYEASRYIKNGLNIVIAGRTNVGKSTLMNTLVNSERSIVTSVPGTTRDVVKESFVLNGVNITVADTAGVHETKDQVETIGIEKARTEIRNADLILFVVDGSVPLEEDDKKLYKEFDGKTKIMVVNKTDLVQGGNPELPRAWGREENVKISALYKGGVGRLKQLISEFVSGGEKKNITGAVPGARHHKLLERCRERVLAAVDGLRTGLTTELIVVDIKDASNALGGIIGDTSRIDSLDSIFSRFCIGK